jgi:hypothetical protein
MFCQQCGQTIPQGADLCAECRASTGKTAALLTGGGLAAKVTIGFMGFVAVCTYLWVTFLVESTVVIPLWAAICFIAEGLHRLVTRRWISFRGPTGRFLR